MAMLQIRLLNLCKGFNCVHREISSIDIDIDIEVDSMILIQILQKKVNIPWAIHYDTRLNG